MKATPNPPNTTTNRHIQYKYASSEVTQSSKIRTPCSESTQMASERWQCLGRKYKSFIKVGIQNISQKPCMCKKRNATKEDRRALGHSRARVVTVVRCHLHLVHAALTKKFSRKLRMIQAFKYVLAREF